VTGRGIRFGASTPVLIAALLAVPASASAVTASVSGSRLSLGGGPEDNQVQLGVAGDPHSVHVTDTAGVVAGAGCDAETPTSAFCGDSATTELAADLGEGTNSIDGIQGGFFVTWPTLKSIAVIAGSGSDTIGPDNLVGAPWTIDAGAGDDTIEGSGESDTIGGGPGDDTINARIGEDKVLGGTGDDDIDGYTGDDQLFGEEGSDKVDGDDGSDKLDGGPGTDLLQGDGTSSQNAGDDTIDAVDGERDTVSCGFGTDVVDADKIDVVGNSVDCEQVSRSAGEGGGRTAKPKPKPFRPHCKTKHGHRRCKQPAPLKGKTYKGRTSKGAKVTTGVKGGYWVFKAAKLTYRCADGETFDETSVDIAAADHQKVGRKGTVATEIDYDPGDGFSNEVIYVVAAFDGRKAAGALAGNVTIEGHGNCTSGKVSWTAKA
jgi:Ca2+-binding RTX toxin-like protein